jgi:glycosyltransferase involved in cell wall biosynthesis
MKFRPKVVHVVEAYGGGVLDVVNLAANGLAAVSDQVIVYARRPQTPRNPESLLLPGVRLVEAPFGRGLNPYRDALGVCWLMRLLRAENPDIVHLHSSKAGGLGRLACAAVPRARVFYTPHQFAFLDRSLSPAARALYWGIEALLGRISRATVLACSRSEMQFALGLGARAELVENAVQCAAPAPSEDYVRARLRRLRAGRGLTICAVGRLAGQKNPALFDAMAQMAAVRKPHWRFVWLGDGPLRLTYAEVLGWRTVDEVRQFLAAEADIYVSTSYSEGMPIAAIQAQLAGVPCVVSDVPGNRDAVEGMPGCTTVPRSSPAAFLAALERTATAASLPQLLFLRDSATSRYAPQRFLQELAGHYGLAESFKGRALYGACEPCSSVSSTSPVQSSA